MKRLNRRYYVFSSGEEDEDLHYTWVAITSKSSRDKNQLFSPKEDCELSLELEEVLDNRCNILTLSQRCVDWFLFKIIITGTMAGKIISQVKNQKPPYSPEFMDHLFQ